MKKPRYIYHEWTPTTAFPHQYGVLDTQSGKPVATLETEGGARVVAKYMSEADQRAREELSGYVKVIDGLAEVMRGVVSNPRFTS